MEEMKAQDTLQEELYLSPSQLILSKFDETDFLLNDNIQFTISRATSPIMITKKWRMDDEFNKGDVTSSGSTVFDTMSGLDSLLKADFSLPMDMVDNFSSDEYMTVSHTPIIANNQYSSFFESNIDTSKSFSFNNVLNETSMTPTTSNNRAEKDTVGTELDSLAEEDYDAITTNASLTKNTISVQKVYNGRGKSISDSRLSTESLRQSFQLPSVKAATRLESHVEKLLTEHCNFQLGYKTWVRDTKKNEREHILDILDQKLNEDIEFLFSVTGKNKKLEKRSIETIVRKCTYAKQQSRLRKERRKAAEKNSKAEPKHV